MTKISKDDQRIYGSVQKGTFDEALKAVRERKALHDADDLRRPIYLPTPVLALDVKLGGGWRGGRIYVVYGDENVGKTTFFGESLAVVCGHQKRMSMAQDFEHKFEEERMKAIFARRGANMAKLEKSDRYFYDMPLYAEDGMKTAVQLAASGGLAFMGTDSVAAIVARSEVEKALEGKKNQIGLHASTVRQHVRVFLSLLTQHKMVWLLINQTRVDLDTSPGRKFKKLEKPQTGGSTLRFHTTGRIEIRRGKTLDDGTKIRILRIIKNHVTGWHGDIAVRINEDMTLAWEHETLSFALKHGLAKRIKKKGTTKIELLHGKKKVLLPKEEVLDWIHGNLAFRAAVRRRTLKVELA